MRLKQHNIKRIAFIGIFAAIAMIFSYVEILIPPIFAAVPGIKLGLPNVAIIFILYRLGWIDAAVVSFVRLVLTAMLFGNTMTFAYSVAGALLSLIVMAILKKINVFSTIGVSVAGAVCHNIGQIFVAILLLDTPQIAYYLIVLTVTGTISGVLVGLCGAMLINRVPLSRIK